MPTFQPPRDEPLISVEEAQARVLASIADAGTEDVALVDALGRILREDITAPRDLPPADNSGMDGYAVRHEDVSKAPVSLRVIEDIGAGHLPQQRITRGTAARIMTGAVVPEGADTIVQVELTDAGSESVTVHEAVAQGAHIRRRGDDMRAGEKILASGAWLGPGEIGALASAGRGIIRVARRPEVAILATGDEIVDVSADLRGGQIVNSNSYALAAMTREAGGVPRMCGIARDSRDSLIAAIESALSSDFVISTGGVSAGAYDFVKDALEALGGTTKFAKIAMKPGKPVVLATVRGRTYFGLPGNPVSSMVAFALFVGPALQKAMGRSGRLVPVPVRMKVDHALKSKGDRRTFIRVRVVAREGELVAHPMPSQGSHVITSMIGANGLAIVEEGITKIGRGEKVDVLLLRAVEGE